MLLAEQGDEDEAIRLCQEALDGAMEVLGVDHPHTTTFMGNPWGMRPSAYEDWLDDSHEQSMGLSELAVTHTVSPKVAVSPKGKGKAAMPVADE